MSLLILTGLLMMAACTSTPSRLSVTQTGPDIREPDRVEVVSEYRREMVIITHHFGIGRAELRPSGNRWPGQVALRFVGFRALEGLTLTGRDDTGRVIVREEMAFKREAFLARADVYGRVTIPVPAKLLRPEVDTIRVEWVDFYRR